MKTRCLTSLCALRMLCTLLIAIWSFSITTVWAQPGKDGPLAVFASNTVVNCYSAVTANVTSGSSTVTTDNSCVLGCGDLIMVYQAQGATINTANTDQYGLITAYNNSGYYEFNYVVSNAGGVITVQTPWTNNYSATGMTQVIKVPQYTTLTVNAGASIIPAAWQDAGSYRKGGIVAIHATGTVTINGTIHADALGFRAGVMEQNSASVYPGDFASALPARGGEKGESIAGFGTQYDALGGRYGLGAPANGGGGGNNHNSGGGGGANANNGNTYNGQGVMCTTCTGSAAWTLDPFVIANGSVLTTSSGGGRGAYSYSNSNQNALVLGTNQAAWGGDSRKMTGGWGGKSLAISPTNRIFFGGGGGAGDANNSGSLAGGNGGGIIYIVAPTVTGSGIISAKGANALNQISTSTAASNDGAGGGGGGGTIIIKSALSGTLTLNAKGGKGGDNNYTDPHGNGGGGGGGYVAISSGSPAINVEGGENGISISSQITEFPANGATSGATGQSQTITNSFITFNPVSITASVNTPICSGNTLNFTSSVNYPGGTYSWSGPASFSSALQNPAITTANVTQSGSYRVIYTSPGGCKDTAFVAAVVNQTPVITVTPANPLCAAACNGSAAIAFTTNGTAPYAYSWSNGQTTQTASNLCPGNYNVTVTDFVGCTTSGTVTITSPPALTATVSPTSIACFSSCTGSIIVTASGGTGAYQYSLNGGTYQSSGTFTGLCAGSYNITVKDANNCTYSTSTTITQPTQLTLALVSTVPATCGINNGSLTVSASGGTTAYTYSIGGAGQSSGTFNGLAAGSYTITVTDGAGCTQSVTAVITTVVAPTASLLNQLNVSCFGGVNGGALIGITGGTSPYTYSLNGGTPQASNFFTNLSAASYTAVVSDANNCTSSVSFTITSPTQLTYTSTMTPVTCNGLCDGSIAITPTGGTAPYSFSQNNGSTFSTTNPITGLCAGTINLVVQDGNGCLANSTVIVTQPTAVSATSTSIDPVCNDLCGGQITVTASGGVAGYSYSVSGGAFQASPILTNVCPGTQQFVVQDGNGCQFTQNVTLANPPEIVTTQTSMVESNCGFNNGTLEVTATGVNPPFLYSLNGAPYQSNGLYTNLYGGAYIVVIEDALGCLDSTYFGVNDVEMEGIVLSMTDVTCFGGSDGIIEVSNVSGALPITYEFDNSGVTQTNGIFAGLEEGSHVVAIYDGGLCAFTLPFLISQPSAVTYSSSVTDVTCNGGTNGQIEITGATGGTGTYQYSIDNGATYSTTNIFTGLSAGTYDLVVMDGNNCPFNQQATIDETTPVAITSTSSNLDCFGDNDAYIQLDGSGGNGGYEYSIDGGTNLSSTSLFLSLVAGTYDIVVSDQFGCFATTTIDITQPAQLTANYSATAELCNGSCDGTITTNSTGGTGTHMYSLDNGVTFGINGFIDNLCSGNYTVLILDQNQCQYTFSENIGSAAILTLAQTIGNATCDLPNGTITLTGGGGNGVYAYSIDNGAIYQASGTFTNLAPDTYAVTVQDGNGCITDSVAIVSNEGSPVINGVYTIEPSCNGICDATVSVDAIGGTGALQYTIGTGYQAGSSFTGVCAGTFDVVIMDANGCTDTTVTVIGEPTVLTFNSIANNLSCNQNSSGSIMIAASGGTIPYQYSYNNGVTYTASPSLQFISAGTYDLVVIDGNGCTTSGQEIVTEPTALTISTTTTDAVCNGYCDGMAQVTTGGGTPGAGYTYTWSPNATTTVSDQATALCAGDYWVTVADQNGCLITDSFAIAEPVLFEVTSVTTTEPTCNTDCDASITVTAAGGISYSFDGGTTSGAANTINGVCAGNYNLVVTNAAGCFATTSVTVTQPDPLLVVSTTDSLMCTGDTIPLFSFAYGGTAPYQYSWDNTVNNQEYVVHPETPTSYSVIATDAHGCISPAGTTDLTMLPVLTLDLTSELFICQGSTANLNISVADGAPEYTYLWSTSVNDTLPTLSVTPSTPTNYTVTVSDICMTMDTTVAVKFFGTPQIADLFTENVGCAPFTVVPDTTGMSFMSDCLWTFSDGQVFNGCDNVSVTFDDAGCYDLTYIGTTVNGCLIEQEIDNIVCVNPTPEANFTYTPAQPTIFDNSLNFHNQSSGGISYQWIYFGYSGSSEENPHYTFFNVQPNEEVMVCQQVTSDLGCTDSVCEIIRFSDELLIHIPNTFTPDGTEFNNTFFPVFQDDVLIQEYDIRIFNRWGEVVFKTNDPKEAWDGTFKGFTCPTGTYTWIIELRDGYKDIQHRFTGHVNLLN